MVLLGSLNLQIKISLQGHGLLFFFGGCVWRRDPSASGVGVQRDGGGELLYG